MYFSKPYNAYLFEKILDKTIGQTTNDDQNILEIGVAPGLRLLDLSDRYAWEPYGVDWSKAGVRLTKENFAKRGYNLQNVIHADFLNNEFQKNIRTVSISYSIMDS